MEHRALTNLRHLSLFLKSSLTCLLKSSCFRPHLLWTSCMMFSVYLWFCWRGESRHKRTLKILSSFDSERSGSKRVEYQDSMNFTEHTQQGRKGLFGHCRWQRSVFPNHPCFLCRISSSIFQIWDYKINLISGLACCMVVKCGLLHSGSKAV